MYNKALTRAVSFGEAVLNEALALDIGVTYRKLYLVDLFHYLSNN